MIDDFDKKILSLLQENGRMSNLELSEAISLSTSATLRRIQKLTDNNIIQGYTVLLDEKMLNINTQVILRVTLDGQDGQKLDEFEDQVTKIPNVLSCYLIGGDYDYLIRIAVKDIADYEKLHKKTLSKLPHVQRLQSNFALKEIVKRINPIIG